MSEVTVLEGTLQWMELVDEEDEPVGVAVLIGEQDLLSILSDLEGRRVRVTVEVIDEGEASSVIRNP